MICVCVVIFLLLLLLQLHSFHVAVLHPNPQAVKLHDELMICQQYASCFLHCKISLTLVQVVLGFDAVDQAGQVVNKIFMIII